MAGRGGQRGEEAGPPSASLPDASAPPPAPPPPLPALARRRLTYLLIAKSIAEALFVGALAVVFYYLVFNPYFRGAVDEAGAGGVSGWVVDESRPSAHVEVQLYVDGRFVASRFADEARTDVYAAGRAADTRHGFTFPLRLEASGEHEARVYAVHASGGEVRRTLQLVGHAVRFTVAADAGGTTPEDSAKHGASGE